MHAENRVPRDDQMVGQVEVERNTQSSKTAGKNDICLARIAITRGMITNEHDCSCSPSKRMFDHRSKPAGNALSCSVGNLAVAEILPSRSDQYHLKPFGAKRPERSDQLREDRLSERIHDGGGSDVTQEESCPFRRTRSR